MFHLFIEKDFEWKGGREKEKKWKLNDKKYKKNLVAFFQKIPLIYKMTL